MTNEDVMAVDERLARLEKTVAESFFEQGRRLDKIDGRLDTMDGRLDTMDGRLDTMDGRLDTMDGRLEKIDGRLGKTDGRFDRLEDRMTALDSKFNIAVESIRGDVKTVLEVMTGFAAEMRRTTESMRKEHEADRRLTRAILVDHVTRIRALEGGEGSTGSQ